MGRPRGRPKAKPLSPADQIIAECTRTMTKKMLYFCEYYLATPNGNMKDAARKAGYTGNEQAIHRHAKRLMDRDDVARYISSPVRQQVNADDVMAAMVEQAFRCYSSCAEKNPETGEVHLTLEKLWNEGKMHL